MYIAGDGRNKRTFDVIKEFLFFIFLLWELPEEYLVVRESRGSEAGRKNKTCKKRSKGTCSIM